MVGINKEICVFPEMEKNLAIAHLSNTGHKSISAKLLAP